MPSLSGLYKTLSQQFPATSMANPSRARLKLLLLSILFLGFVSSQFPTNPLIPVNPITACMTGLTQSLDCSTRLSLINGGSFTNPLTSTCCNFLRSFANQVMLNAFQCLCILARFNILVMSTTVPCDIRLILSSCGLPAANQACLPFAAAHSALASSPLPHGRP